MIFRATHDWGMRAYFCKKNLFPDRLYALCAMLSALGQLVFNRIHPFKPNLSTIRVEYIPR